MAKEISWRFYVYVENIKNGADVEAEARKFIGKVYKTTPNCVSSMEYVNSRCIQLLTACILQNASVVTCDKRPNDGILLESAGYSSIRPVSWKEANILICINHSEYVPIETWLRMARDRKAMQLYVDFKKEFDSPANSATDMFPCRNKAALCIMTDVVSRLFCSTTDVYRPRVPAERRKIQAEAVSVAVALPVQTAAEPVYQSKPHEISDKLKERRRKRLQKEAEAMAKAKKEEEKTSDGKGTDEK